MKKETLQYSSIAGLVVLVLFTVAGTNIRFSKNGPILGTKSLYAQKKSKEQMIVLNFPDVEIKEFLKMMGEVRGKHIVAADNVRGKITVISSNKVPYSQAYNLMKEILELKGFAVIESEHLIKVVQINDAIEKNKELIVDEKGKITIADERTITYIFHVKKGDAYQIRNALNTLKPKNTKVISYEDLNYIIIAGIASDIEGLVKLAEELDKPLPFEEEDGEEGISKGNIHVIHLQNANAEELANVLARVPFSETAKIDKSPSSTNKVNTSKKAKKTTKTPVSTQKKSQLSIIANKDTNSLIITANKEEFKMIKAIIDELDIVREQVLIEALIIEVSAENGWGFGIDWMVGDNFGGGTVGTSQLLGTASTSSLSTMGSEIGGKTAAMPLTSNAFQLGYVSDNANLGFILLNASANDRNFNVISTPQILTIDNQEAEINVGDEFPIPTNNVVNSDGTQSYSYDYKTAGLKLKITPHITRSNKNGELGKITLDLYQEVNDVITSDTTSTTYIPPDINRRDLKTRISILDGKTIVVGGLIQNKKTQTETKVPLLGDIPVLGWLFKRQAAEYQKTNLLIFITPHILTDAEKLEKVSKEKREEQKVLQK